MRVLIIDDDLRTVATARLALQATGYDVEHVAANDPRREEVLRRSFDIVILDWTTPAAMVDLRHKLDKHPVPASVMVWTTLPTPATLAAVFDAGAEDLLRKPFVREELLGRTGRIARTRSRMAGSVAGARARTSAATRLAAWQRFNALAVESLAGMTTLDLGPVEAPREWTAGFAASMPLSYTPEHLEFRVAVDGASTALQAISTAALGLGTPEVIADLLNEMANVAGGAFMRAALEEKVTLTSGLPKAAAPAIVDSMFGGAHDLLTCWLGDPVSKAIFRVRLAVRARGNVLVDVTSLREGMVLAKDILGAGGVLLLRAGTRVTSSTSERVRSLLDGRCSVEVADCAA